MAQIFISAGHGGFENGITDTGAKVDGITEAQEMISIRDLIVPELRSRGLKVLSVPDDLSLQDSISWINARNRNGDIALEIHLGAFQNTNVRGATAYYIASNEARKAHADLMLLALLRRVPQLPSLGGKPDTAAGMGRLAFCRQVAPPSILMELGYLTNDRDRSLLLSRRRDFALGLADGLASWSRTITGTPPPTTPTQPQLPTVNITVNGGAYEEQGIIVNNNSYVPIDLADRLGIDLAGKPDIRRVRYGNVVYIKTIDLREFNIAIGWDAASRTVQLKTQSTLTICPGLIDQIMGHGNASEVSLMMFLKNNNEKALRDFPDIHKIYRQEGVIEGVNYDIAFCQMCLETSFLRFGGDVKASQNNFASIGAIGGNAAGASFPSARIGVRAQIQHLKAYASKEPLVQEQVDPRFRFVSRGSAVLVDQLSGRWAADPNYGEKIMAMVRRLYESAKLL
ncbi:cell wall hydrolase autolysin [Leptolyngbya sp. Heron Island J]|uniref:hormogonium tapered terminus morphoprotein TftA n=1 Tax=Leptolyngbya sp. Heron Island J TaxID=1385935 RepID=UPI0003B9EC77|nr:N-acetylmuramoyl-L-alanine amidase [Leptolyngbya sp. Heron Island J]ESA37192.1 cell wall hydrolase autolysin [Leptolyngbya sp. Heron Island J]